MAAVVISIPDDEYVPPNSLGQPEAKGNPLVGFSAPQLGGGTWSLADHKGEVVLVNFWAVWCEPCRIETPFLVATAQKYKGKGFEIVGVSMDNSDPAAVRAYVAQYRIAYPILLPSLNSPIGSVVATLPTSVLIGRDGHIVHSYLGVLDAPSLTPALQKALRP